MVRVVAAWRSIRVGAVGLPLGAFWQTAHGDEPTRIRPHVKFVVGGDEVSRG